MKKIKEYDSNPSDYNHAPRFRNDDDFIAKSNRPTSGSSSASLNGPLRSARFSTNSAMNRQSMTVDVPDAKSPYGRITHTVRQIVPQDIACKLGCRGAKCKYDNSDWPSEQMVLNGIYSNWYYLSD